jgi:hypothetical protein
MPLVMANAFKLLKFELNGIIDIKQDVAVENTVNCRKLEDEHHRD